MPVQFRAAAALTAVALVICYASTVDGMLGQWMTDEDMGHGFSVPFVVLWIIWRERDRWNTRDYEASPWGLVILLLGLGLHVIGAVGAGLFASAAALLLSVTGTIVTFGGFRLLRSWIFPMILALFMLPKLAVVYNQVTLPMQLLASKLAASMLTFSGAAVIREGNILDIGGHRIEVAEACNGIRYMLPLGFSGVVFAYLFDEKSWMRIVLLIAAVPTAVVANAVRVAAIALVPALDTGVPHTLAGLLIFVVCMGVLALVQQGISFAHGRIHA